MKLKNDLYEQVISKLISDKLNILSDTKLIDKDKIDQEESSQLLTKYLSQVIYKGFIRVRSERYMHVD